MVHGLPSDEGERVTGRVSYIWPIQIYTPSMNDKHIGWDLVWETIASVYIIWLVTLKPGFLISHWKYNLWGQQNNAAMTVPSTNGDDDKDRFQCIWVATGNTIEKVSYDGERCMGLWPLILFWSIQQCSLWSTKHVHQSMCLNSGHVGHSPTCSTIHPHEDLGHLLASSQLFVQSQLHTPR